MQLRSVRRGGGPDALRTSRCMREMRPGSSSTAATQSQARLLVLGPHRKRPLRDALEGTIAEKALATKNYPVLVVRDAAPQPYRRVLLALDASDASASAIRAAESLVLTPGVEATVVHAHKPPYEGMLYAADVEMQTVVRYAENWKREAQQSMRELLSFESDDAARYDIRIEQRPATPGIFKPLNTSTGSAGDGHTRRRAAAARPGRQRRQSGSS